MVDQRLPFLRKQQYTQYTKYAQQYTVGYPRSTIHAISPLYTFLRVGILLYDLTTHMHVAFLQ